MIARRLPVTLLGLLTALALALLTGCAGAPADTNLIELVNAGEQGRARLHVYRNLSEKREDRDYLLGRMRLLITTLADGYSAANDVKAEELYDSLRVQGVNADKGAMAVLLNEDLKFWKGEPFEQAMALHYVSVHYALQESWDNTRAAAQNTLFQLKDFGKGAGGESLTNEELVSEAQKKDEAFLDKGYVAQQSNFALGYLMSGIASGQLGRADEASDNFNQVLKLNPKMGPEIERLRGGRYNAVLVVDFGRGPQKIGTGPDNAIASFLALTPSDDRLLAVTVNGQTQRVPVICDLNEMARDHMWNNLQDVRLAKSYLGTALVGAGAITAAYGADRGNDAALAAGLGMLLAGVVAKAGAHADTRYCETMPQRVYVVPLQLPTGGPSTVDMQIDGLPHTRMVLAQVPPPATKGPALLRYVRLPTFSAGTPAWAQSPQVYYSSDSCPHATVPGTRNFPFILGGGDVRTPTDDVLTSYQQAGYLKDLSLGQLLELYRLEGIVFDARDSENRIGLHVLEGGRSLIAPLPGSAGFQRLFCQQHPPYIARSKEVAQWQMDLGQAGQQ